MKVILVVILLISFFVFVIKPNTFHSRCYSAGYEKGEHEQCVHRLKKGGFVYD